MDVMNNLDTVLTLLLSAHALALAIVNLTPTPKDDDFVAKVYRFVEVLAGFIHPNAKK